MSARAKGAVASLAAVLAALPLVATYEGYVPGTYADPVGIPTVCYGETDRAMTLRGRFTREECTAVLGASLMRHADALDACIHRPVTANEAAALLSWAYNVGTDAACGSTLVRKLNAGAPPSEWCAEMSRWTRAGGVELRGLVKRRAAERATCEARP